MFSSNVWAQSGNVSEALRVLKGQLSQIGLTVCTQKIMDISKFLMANDNVNFVLVPVGPVNSGILTLTIANVNPKTNVRSLNTWVMYANLNTCSGAYEQINHWEASCEQVKKEVFSNFGELRPLIGGISQAKMSADNHVYFLPSGTGCTSMKQEAFQ